MNAPALLVHQVRYEQKAFWRNPASAFFTFVFPLVFLVIFASLNNGTTIDFLGGLDYNQFYVPAIIAFGIISATYTQIGINLSFRRQTGELKRFRATPLPPGLLVGGLLANAVLVGLLIFVLTTVLGVVAYGVRVPTHYLALAVALLVGAATFCALGVAVACLVPNADAAPAVVNGVLFPILFLSGVFFPLEPGSVLARIADVFPGAALLRGRLRRVRPPAAGRARPRVGLGRHRDHAHLVRRRRARLGAPVPLGAAPLTGPHGRGSDGRAERNRAASLATRSSSGPRCRARTPSTRSASRVPAAAISPRSTQPFGRSKNALNTARSEQARNGSRSPANGWLPTPVARSSCCYGTRQPAYARPGWSRTCRDRVDELRLVSHRQHRTGSLQMRV